MIKLLLRLYGLVHGLIALLFALLAVTLLLIAALDGWRAISNGLTTDASNRLIDVIGLFAVAIVALQVSQTIAEEEVVREAHISSPTRVRRYLSRFMVVIVVALVLEGLVATMKALHSDMGHLPHAALTLMATGVLLAGWGGFLRLNAAPEQMEPEAMDAVKDEDRKFE